MTPRSKPARSRPVLIAALLGLNCWITSVMLPAWHLGGLGALSSWVILLALLALLSLGLGVLSLQRRGRVSVTLLLAVFPALILATAAIQPSLTRAPMMAPAAVVIAGLGFAAFLIGACWALGTVRVQMLEATTTSLEDQPPRRRGGLTLFLLATAAGAVVVTITTAHLRSFDAGDTLRLAVLSTGALALWATVIFGVVAPALRHRRPWPMSSPSRGAAVVWFMVVILGAIMLLLSGGNEPG